MPKLIDAEAAKAALEKILQSYRHTLSNFEKRGRTHQSHIYHSEGLVNGMEAAVVIIDALPDASDGFFDYIAKEAHRTGKSPQEVFAAEWEAHVKLKDDALWPDVSEKAIHIERIPVPPHLAEAQRVVIDRAAKSQKSEWSRQHIDQWRKGSESEKAQQAGDGAEEK